MPHYADGTEAKVGDIVEGHGYNVKHKIIGKVTQVKIGESCNLVVAYIGTATPIFAQVDGEGKVDMDAGYTPVILSANFEYGDTKSFTKIA